MSSPEMPVDPQKQTFLLLRWILIIATAYLVLFARPLNETPPIVALFIATYLASNLVVGFLLPRVHSRSVFHTGIVLFDTLAVSLGLLLTQSTSSDLYLLYFLVVLIGTLTENALSAAGLVVVVSLVQMLTVARFAGAAELLTSHQLLRLPFLFVVGLFFGHLAERSRSVEREATDARKQQRAVAEAVAMLSHDIKTSLTTILGFAEILHDEPPDDPEQRRDLMERIEASAQQAVTLAINFMDAARIESGSLRLQQEMTSLNEIVEHALRSQQSVARVRKISIEAVFGPDLPDVPLDSRMFDRVVLNLVTNAIKFSPKNEIIHVRTARRDGRLVLSVRDHGPGIPPGDRPKLFQRFGLFSGSGSTGLGLFIVKTIVEAHGGEIAVDCPPEGGSIFEVFLSLTGARLDHNI